MGEGDEMGGGGDGGEQQEGVEVVEEGGLGDHPEQHDELDGDQCIMTHAHAYLVIVVLADVVDGARGAEEEGDAEGDGLGQVLADVPLPREGGGEGCEEGVAVGGERLEDGAADLGGVGQRVAQERCQHRDGQGGAPEEIGQQEADDGGVQAPPAQGAQEHSLTPEQDGRQHKQRCPQEAADGEEEVGAEGVGLGLRQLAGGEQLVEAAGQAELAEESAREGMQEAARGHQQQVEGGDHARADAQKRVLRHGLQNDVGRQRTHDPPHQEAPALRGPEFRTAARGDGSPGEPPQDGGDDTCHGQRRRALGNLVLEAAGHHLQFTIHNAQFIIHNS